MARECGINANQLGAWIRRHERGSAKAVAPIEGAVQMTQPAFVPVAIDATKQEAVVTVDLQARLPNGVVVDLRGCDMQQTQELIDALGRLRCSASTRA